MDGAAEKEVAGWHVSVQHILILPETLVTTCCADLKDVTQESQTTTNALA